MALKLLKCPQRSCRHLERPLKIIIHEAVSINRDGKYYKGMDVNEYKKESTTDVVHGLLL